MILYVTLGRSILYIICPIILIIIIFFFKWISSNFSFDIIFLSCFFWIDCPAFFIACSYIYKLTWDRVDVRFPTGSFLKELVDEGWGRIKCYKTGMNIVDSTCGYFE